MKLVMESRVFVLFALVSLRILPPATSQDCFLPDGDAINTILRSLLISHGGEGNTLVTTLLNHHFTCLAVGSSRDQYRQVSVAVRYTNSSAGEQFTAQFPLRCTTGNLASVGELDKSPPVNAFNISTRRDCFICTTVNSQPGFTIDTTSDCALCNSFCLMMGQGGCKSTAADCCPFYDDNDSCTTSCDTNFNATSSSNYTCVCSLSCDNGGTLNGDNCTCLCSDGFTGTNCDIDINDCASNPCVNGTCTDLINGYNCTCLMGYTGQNCTSRVDPCILNPCQNGGNCSSKDEGMYECSCLTSWSGPNCTQCTVPNCAQCSQIMEGQCEECNPGYMILGDTRQCSLLWILFAVLAFVVLLVAFIIGIVGLVKCTKHVKHRRSTNTKVHPDKA